MLARGKRTVLRKTAAAGKVTLKFPKSAKRGTYTLTVTSGALKKTVSVKLEAERRVTSADADRLLQRAGRDRQRVWVRASAVFGI